MVGTSLPQIKKRNTRSAAKADALTALNQQASPLLRLPGELRNRIYDYAFSEQCILVRRSLSARFHLLVEPKQYLFFNLLATTTVCRQIHAEASLLPFHQNVFRFHHLETVQEFSQCVCLAQLTAITNLRFALFLPLSVSEPRIKALASTSMRPFMGLVKVVVEMRHWRRDDMDLDKTQPWHTCLQQDKKMLEGCMRQGVEIVFE